MDARLIKFLATRVVEKGKDFTHTSKISPMRRYHIDSSDLDEFYNIYNSVIAEKGIAGITEKPEAIVPLIVDIDFKCSLSEGLKRRYKASHIKEIVKVYQEIISEIAKQPTPNMFICCVLEKTAPVNYKGTCKDGFHLHFPNFFTEQWVQKEYIRTEVIKRVQERKILNDIKILEPIDKVFDKNIPSNCWLMYGSRKEVKSEAYQITKYYNKDMELLPIRSVFKKMPSGTREWNLPKYMSIRKGILPTPLNENLPIKKPFRKKKKLDFKRDLTDILADLIISEQLLEMLDDDRADDYKLWIEIGWILYNISEGHPKGLELWITFSTRSEKFEDGVCEKLWDKMEIRNYSLGTLKYLARNDSPNEFIMWRDSQISSHLEQGISMAHNDIAKIIHIMFENQYVCADVEKEIWYEFKGHRWVRSAKGIDLRKHLSTTLCDQYTKLAQVYSSKVNDEEDQSRKQIYNAKILMICKLIEKLRNNTFKNCVIKECMEYFYNPDFINKMDENPNLLVCENGVYDSEQKIFRDGRPDDFCTKTTGLYYQEFDEDDPRIVTLNEILRKIFVNEKLFTFFKQTASDLIRGGNRHKIFVIWTGVGDNGKSVCSDLLERALGEYFYTPPTSILTSKQHSSSNATAELMPCKGARVVVVSETDNVDVLNCGTMKKFTGGDPFYARGLFKEPIKITPQFKLILHCNKMPNISAEDKASWNRIRVLPFESIFVKDHLEPKNLNEQYAKKIFPMDRSLKDKRIGELAEVFLWWLIKEYEAFGDSDLIEPPGVQDATSAYHKTNDHYLQFFDERIQVTSDQKDYVTLHLIYTLFKEWYKDSFPGRTIPTRIQVKEAMEKKLGPYEKGVWRKVTTFDPDTNSEESEDND